MELFKKLAFVSLPVVILPFLLVGCGVISGGGPGAVLYTSKGTVVSVDYATESFLLDIDEDTGKSFFDSNVVSFDGSRIVSGKDVSSLEVGSRVSVSYLKPSGTSKMVVANSIELLNCGT